MSNQHTALQDLENDVDYVIQKAERTTYGNPADSSLYP